jgi:DNA-binding response OmpR family regulator
MPVTSSVPAALADDAPHLLLVDDDRRIRNLLSRFLLAEGYRVTTAETAADARAKLEGLRFDLLILDVMMPGETGFSLARDLRSTSNVPIIMLTARVEAHSRIEGLAIGADDYLGKPFEPKELSLRIASILRRSGGERKSFGSRIASATCFVCSRQRRARPCRGPPWPGRVERPASAPSMCRSIGCAGRSSATRPIRSSFKLCVV